MQIWVGGQNFSFPTLFDSYRELLLKIKWAKITTSFRQPFQSYEMLKSVEN